LTTTSNTELKRRCRSLPSVRFALSLIGIFAVFAVSCSADDSSTVDEVVAPTPSESSDTAEPDLTREEAASECMVVPEGFGPAGEVEIETDVVASGLETPWAIDWLPGGEMLVTERSGAILRVTTDGTVVRPAVAEIPVTETSEGGLLGLAVHPEFESNRWFYIYYGGADDTNQVERWVLAEDNATAVLDKVILSDIPAAQFHSGGRLRFGPDGHLYIGTGDAATLAFPQDLESLSGKILRVTDEGEIPDDNPFPGSPVWVYGVRNTQGLAWTDDGTMITTDHGPSGLPHEDGRSGHDELNIVVAGDNLGWPELFACEEGDDVVSPIITWAEALPPAGLAVYTGTEIPEWQGDIVIGVLGFGDIGQLHRIRLDDDGAVAISESYLVGSGFGRIRDVAMGPDGGLYFTTSNCDGRGACGDGDLIVRVGRGYDGPSVDDDIGQADDAVGEQENDEEEAAPDDADFVALSVEPTEVDGPGVHEFVVQSTGWTSEGIVFVVPCFGVTTVEALGESESGEVCDLSMLASTELVDGGFELVVEYDVPAAGMCIGSADATFSETGGACVSVTASGNG